MRAPHGARHLAALLPLMALAACAPAPVAERPAPAPAPRAAPGFESYEQRQREQALALTTRGQLAQAQLAWEVLAVMRPERAEYRGRLEEVNAQIRKTVGERLQAAAEARRRGDAEQATLAYLKVLSLDPDNPAAAQGLREIEQARAIRSNHPRAARPAMAQKPERTAPKSSPPADAAERRDLDYGVMLFHQGDYAASVKTLEQYQAGNPKDALARRYLADGYAHLGQQRLQQGRREEALFLLDKAKRLREQESPELDATVRTLRRELADEQYQLGLRAYNSDIRRAIDHWERSLRFDPSHVQAGVRLQQARKMLKNLRAIEGAGTAR